MKEQVEPIASSADPTSESAPPSESIPLVADLEQLEAAGAFVSGALVPRDIKFKLNGVQHSWTIHVKQFSVADLEAIPTGKDRRSRVASSICEGVFLGKDGKQHIPYAKAAKLVPAIALAMFDAFNEVNGSKPKN